LKGFDEFNGIEKLGVPGALALAEPDFARYHQRKHHRHYARQYFIHL